MRTSMRPHRMNRGNQEEGFALISAIVFLMLILVLGSSLVQQAVQELHTATRAKKETAAFNLAEAGIDYAAWKLYYSPTTLLPVTWTRSNLGTGTFSVTASPYGGSAAAIQLLSTGTTQGWNSQVKVVGNFLTTGPSKQNAVFDYAMFSNADASFVGGLDVTGNAFANGSFDLKGAAKVSGNVGATGNVTVQGSAGVGGQIQQRQAKVPMPVVDMQYYRNKASLILAAGPIPSKIDGVVIIDGPLSLHGQTTITGKGVIVVNGDVTINAGTVVDVSSESDEFAIVTNGSVKINGNCTIEGWIYAHNVTSPSSFSGQGGAVVTGGVAADILAKCSGGLTICYKAATVELPGATSAPAQFAAVSWRRVR